MLQGQQGGCCRDSREDAAGTAGRLGQDEQGQKCGCCRGSREVVGQDEQGQVRTSCPALSPIHHLPPRPFAGLHSRALCQDERRGFPLI